MQERHSDIIEEGKKAWSGPSNAMVVDEDFTLKKDGQRVIGQHEKRHWRGFHFPQSQATIRLLRAMLRDERQASSSRRSG